MTNENNEEPSGSQTEQNKFLIPGAIVIAGLVIAGAIFSSSAPVDKVGNNLSQDLTESQPFGNKNSALAENMRPLGPSDHVRGNPDAKVAIVEYSDYECPYCRIVHPTISQILEDYSGEVKWVFRHFPLTSIHSRALEAAVASECAAAIGGNEVFWNFTDGVFNNQGELGRDLYLGIASDLSIPEVEFEQCLTESGYSDIVQADFENAVQSGGTGTPFIIIINGKGELLPFSGALPYETFKALIEEAIQTS